MKNISVVDEEKIDILLNVLYETALMDTMYRNDDLMKAYKRYMAVHTYNHIKGEKTILKDIIEESEARQDLAYYMDKYKPSVMQEFERLAKNTVKECRG